MKTRLLVLACLLSTTAAFAEAPVRRTIVVRDGKVISNNTSGSINIDLERELFGGTRAYLGVSLLDLTPELRDHMGGPKASGILVSAVEDGSPAEKAGIRVGDILLSVDGADVASASELRRELRDKKEGDTARLELQRGKSRQTVVATVTERENGPVIFTRDVDGLRPQLNNPEWKARIDSLGDCGSLQNRIKELETRLKDLERKLQK
jgi:membrane-associated protease RseP (regulator of RpoE activity)